MYLNDEIDELINALKSKSGLGEITFLKAFPYAKKPTRLERKCAVLSPNSISLESISVDNDDLYGMAEIRIDLFSPFRLGSSVVFDDMQKIINSAMRSNIGKISISPLSKDEITECYCVTAILGFGYYQNAEGS